MSAVNRLQRDFYRWRFNLAARGIHKTAPLHQGTLPFILLSMVHKRDVLSYLVAAKSFCRFVNASRVVVICDPSIDEEDRKILSRHIPHIELRSASEFRHPDIPQGGCWERLFAISSYNREAYVVQLDADTITTNAIPEVLEAITRKQGFVLGEEENQTCVSLESTSKKAKGFLSYYQHIQTHSEAVMDEVGLPAGKCYVRGCAGFTGFPHSEDMREEMLQFSRRMAIALEKRWSEWGTEQVTSNYLVANTNGVTVLPFPKYGTPDVASENSAFLHFIGSMRFINNKYQKTLLAALANLQDGKLVRHPAHSTTNTQRSYTKN